MKVLILGVNGFIGSHLSHRILKDTDWEIYGMDLGHDKLGSSRGFDRFHFVEGDIAINKEWIEYHIKKCDAGPAAGGHRHAQDLRREPSGRLRAGFRREPEDHPPVRQIQEAGDLPLHLRGLRHVPGRGLRRVQLRVSSSAPSTRSDGSTPAPSSCSTGLSGPTARQGLDFTIFRPFNWIGARLDSLETAKEGSSRVVTQFISALVNNEPIALVDGGTQSRSFTYIDDGISAIMKIIENTEGKAKGRIFNIGNPANNCSIKDLADKLIGLFKNHPSYSPERFNPRVEIKKSQTFYGDNYQDINTRVPSIGNAKKFLDWQPKVALDDALKFTMDSFLKEINL